MMFELRGRSLLLRTSTLAWLGSARLVEGPIVVIKAMVCRRWDSTNAFGKYLSTEYLLSDAEEDLVELQDQKLASSLLVFEFWEKNWRFVWVVSATPLEKQYYSAVDQKGYLQGDSEIGP
ncbi:hypothetical protein V2J09_004394 [Rumex salicifolius]